MLEKKLKGYISIILAFISGMVFGMFLQAFAHDWQHKAVHKWTNMDGGEVESWIRKSVPIGTSRRKVVQFLNNALIEHYGEDDTDSPDILLAVVPSVKSSSPFVNVDVVVKFTFENGNLKSYQFERRLTGP